MVMLFIGILAPFVEEIIFRGLIYQTFKTHYSMTTTIFLQASIFAVIHINPLQILYTFILALLFVWLVISLNSLWASILMHMSFNLTTIIVLRIIKENESVFQFSLLVVFAIILFSIGLGTRMISKYK
ncbi:MAG TPA: CPBP family intramembrane metalloprotease [Candidatus Paenibacillus intestinavium]|nr:CPBP family intramembrane metalloprotease [Candidatus Paenibacillus intestinavium]